MDKKYLSKLTISGTTYDLKDAEARQDLVDIKSSITGAMHYLGASSTAIADGDATGPWTIDGATYIASGTPAEGQTLLVAGDVATYDELEFIWGGASPKWHEYGSTGSLKALAFKDSATGSVTCAGSNTSSSVSLSGGSTAKLATTSITGTNGTESVSKVTKTASKLVTTSITPTNGTESVSKVTKTTSKLATTSITPTNGTETLHDTPTLNTSNIGSASGWSAGTMFSASVNEGTETITFTAGTAPSLTVTSTAVGTSLTAGTEKTVAKAGSAITVATGSLNASDANGASIISAVTISDKTVAKVGDAITVATGSVASDGEGSDVVTAVTISDKTVAKAAGSATIVATGKTAASDANGDTVATALHTGGTAAAQTFNGSTVSVTVS